MIFDASNQKQNNKTFGAESVFDVNVSGAETVDPSRTGSRCNFGPQ
jgi:hypothetical protein